MRNFRVTSEAVYYNSRHIELGYVESMAILEWICLKIKQFQKTCIFMNSHMYTYLWNYIGKHDPINIRKHHCKQLNIPWRITNKGLNHETEIKKATPVGSTALMLQLFKLEKFSRTRYVYCLCISNSHIDISNSHMFINTPNYISMLSMNHLNIVFAT